MRQITAKRLSILILVLFSTVTLFSQIVGVGNGSYTTVFPGTDEAGRNTYPSGTPQISGVVANKPVPTNDWWSNLIKEDHGGQAFNYPLSFRSKTSGLVINYTKPNAGSTNEYREPMSAVDAIVVGVDGLTATKSTATNHSDWTVTMNWNDGAHDFNATMGMGMPFVYFTKGSSNVAKINVGFNAAGVSVSGNKLLIENNYNSSNYIVFAPAGSTWSGSGGTYTSTLNGKNYWSIVMIPDGMNISTAISYFENFAYVFPSDTRANWSYDNNGKVETTFEITPEVKEGTNSTVLQGLLPHHWAKLAVGSAQPNSYSYATVRGELKLIESNTFIVENRFSGILPTLPDLAKYSAGFNPAALYNKIDQMKSDALPTWTDSYNQGQDMNRLIQAAHIAHQIGFAEARDKLVTTVQQRLEDWLTAENGEVAFIFYYNSNYKTMIGYPAGHRQDENLNDHHFHWGYFIHAAAAVEQYNPGWAAQWGDMINLLVRDAASASRTDNLFPYLRNFSPFAGHCWANGFATEPFGNDQESTSESMQFNSALIHWGEVTGNTEIRDLGIYLYTTEQSAVEEYWFDVNDRTFQDSYAHEMVARIWGGGYDNGTWWTSDIAASYGIQLYPIHGGSLYLGHNPAYVQKVWDGMKSKTQVLSNVANDNLWYDVYWNFLSFIDPAQAISLYDSYPDRNLKVGLSDAHTYHWLHSMNAMGKVAPEVTADYPVAAAFNNSGNYTYVAYNYSNTAKTVHFSNGYNLEVPARSMATNRDIDVSVNLAASALEVPSNGLVTLTASVSGSGITKVEFYKDGSLIGSDVSAPYTINSGALAAGFPGFYAKVYVGTDCNVSNVVKVQAGSQFPYNNNMPNIPGTIETGNYDEFEGGKGQGIAYSDNTSWNEGGYRPTEAVDAATDVNEGATVGWIEGGEWLEYTVHVQQSGKYKLDIRFASGNTDGGGPFYFEIDGIKKSADILADYTGDWGAWQTKSVQDVPLVMGENVIRLVIANGGFNLGKITFTRTGPLENTPPVARAGNDQNIQLPTNTAQLDGSASSDDDNDPLTYGWVKLTGPSVTMSNTNQAIAQLSNLVEGVYEFELTVSDGGDSNKDQVKVIVTNPGLVAPVANAGADKSITLPENSVTINGSATDADGTITGYNWQQISGPSTASLSGEISAILTASDLQEGMYVFRLTATDNNNLTDTDDVSVVVNPDGGQVCTGTPNNGDYTWQASADNTNPTITFIPGRSGVGDNIVILYYGKTEAGGYPGYVVTPNQAYQINATQGEPIYFYYTYSIPEGGERNTMNEKHNFTVGNCGSVTPVLTSITVSPSNTSVQVGETQQFTATGYDQFNQVMSINPTWSVSGGGTLSQTGLFTATTIGANFTITAADNGISGTAQVTVTSMGQTCTGGPDNGDYTYEISSDASNPTITFKPGRTGVGNNIVILYYGTVATGNYPGYIVNTNQAYQITASQGQTIYFYYTYSVPEGGERNTSNERHNFEVGNCSVQKLAMISAPDQILNTELKIYPNPVQRELIVEINSEWPTTIKILDISGKVVMYQELKLQKTIVNTDNLRKGIYMVELTNTAETIRRKIVKE